MNPTQMVAPIFRRRRSEWNPIKVKQYIDKIFSTITVLQGWRWEGSEYVEVTRPKKKEDLKKSIYSVLRTKLIDPEGREYEYSLQVPDLYYDQFFFIGGFLKVPIFQLFDLPIIYRATSSGSILKLRTNAISITTDLNRRDEVVQVNLFNKDIPIHLLISAFHNQEELNAFKETHPSEQAFKKLDSDGNVIQDNGEILERIYAKCVEKWQVQRTPDEIHAEIGEYFMNQPSEKYKKGESTLFSLKAAYEVDHFSREFFHTNSLLFEILHAVWEGPRSDTNIHFKRTRFAEYILAPLIHKIYDMLITLHKHHKDKFQIPQNLILEHCNTSDGKNTKDAVANIVHYNNPINPVGELASFLQCSLVGPGGFKKDNVPPHLRNMDESQYGLLCPADTPDREGCGVIQNMVSTIKVDELGRFGEITEELVSSHPISLVPFMQNDDATRLQMASNQIKQTIMLKSSQLAMIRSGNEGLYLNETTFYRTAKEDGIVIHLDPSFMIVLYDQVSPKQVDIFNIKYRGLYLNTIDYIEPMRDTGQRFQKGDVLCQSLFIKNGELCLGQNLLTAVMIWKGFNYEDGIVIAESVKKKMTSVHTVDLSFEVDSGQVLLSLVNDEYIPLPKIGQTLRKGEVYAKIKNLDWETGFDNINEEPLEEKCPLDCRITSIEIFPNTWNKQVDEFSMKIKEIIGEQLTRYNLIVNALSPFMNKQEIDKFVVMNGLSCLNCDDKHIGNLYNKGQKIGGVYFRIKAVYEEEIDIGDKVANRHGNKGVIAQVIPDDQMPIMADGRRPEIIINPLGIVSRMNVGQLLELHVGEAIYQLRQKMKADEPSARSLLEQFLDILDNSGEHWAKNKVLADFDKNVQKSGLGEAIDNIYVIMPPFESSSPEQIMEAMRFAEATETTRLTLFTGDQVKRPIARGYMYFEKLVHRASDKVSARSIGPYNKKTSQPMGGKANQGGHRLGEMEVWALLAHNAKDFLKDLLTVQSDSIGRKNQVLSEILQNPSLTEGEDQDTTPQSLKIMEAYLNVIGITMTMDNGRIPDILKQQREEDNTDEQQIVEAPAIIRPEE